MFSDRSAISRYCVCVNDECDDFGVPDVVFELVADSGVAGYVDNGEVMGKRGERSEGRIGLEGGVRG